MKSVVATLESENYRHDGKSIMCKDVVFTILGKTPPKIEIFASKRYSSSTPYEVTMSKNRMEESCLVDLQTEDDDLIDQSSAWYYAFEMTIRSFGMDPETTELTIFFGIKELKNEI